MGSRFDCVCDDDYRFLDINDFARVVGVSVQTAYNWSRRGEPDFPSAIRLPSGRVLVTEKAFMEWREQVVRYWAVRIIGTPRWVKRLTATSPEDFRRYLGYSCAPKEKLDTFPCMETKLADTKYLGINDIARILGVSMSTVYKWSSRGGPDFPRVIRLPNGRIRVTQKDFDSWLGQLAG